MRIQKRVFKSAVEMPVADEFTKSLKTFIDPQLPPPGPPPGPGAGLALTVAVAGPTGTLPCVLVMLPGLTVLVITPLLAVRVAIKKMSQEPGSPVVKLAAGTVKLENVIVDAPGTPLFVIAPPQPVVVEIVLANTMPAGKLSVNVELVNAPE